MTFVFPRFWLLASLSALFQHADAVGIKRRLEEADKAKHEQAAPEPGEPSTSASSSTQKPRGGIKQRMQHTTAEPTPPQTAAYHLPLRKTLLKGWSTGELSSAKVLEIAASAAQQGATGMDDMRSLGAHNAFRSLQSVFGYPAGAPQMTWLEIPTKAGPRTAHPFLLPHEFFNSYHTHKKEDWLSTMARSTEACIEFWRGMRQSAFLKNHPSLPASSWGSTIPIGFHGDAGAFSKQDSLYTISWNSLIGAGKTAEKRFVFTVLRKGELVAETLDCVFRILGWSFNSMLCGEFPSKNYYGRPASVTGPLANGWRGAVCQARGDWAFYTEVFKFPAWNCAETMCWMCRASSTIKDLAFSNFAPRSGWRRTRWTHESYLAHLRGLGLAIPALLICIIGFRLECVAIDTLHTVDQGVASHIIGNVFWLIAVKKKAFGGSTQDQQIKNLDSHLRKWYQATKTRKRSMVQGKLTKERIKTSKDWPKLKCKAAATRHLSGYAVHLMNMYGTPEDQPVRALCQLLHRFYEILNEESQCFSPSANAEMASLGSKLCIIYSGLSSKYLADRERFFKMMPKLHLFDHLCSWQASEIGNPRSYWTYADEDLVGLLVECAQSCHVKTLAASAIFKWLHVY